MSDRFCIECGNALSPAIRFCGRCGNEVRRDDLPAADQTRQRPAPPAVSEDAPTVAVSAASADVAAAATTAIPQPAGAMQAWAQPAPPPVSPAPVDPTPRRPPLRPGPPPEVWLVSAGLVALAVLVVWPVARFTPDAISAATSGSALSRAFGALSLQFVAIFWAVGFALGALAVGLLRRSRVAQLLTCVVAAIVAISTLIALGGNAVGSANDGTAAAIVLGAIAVIVLVTAPPTARRFFAADDRPLGVAAAATANVYLGAVALVDGALLCLAGVAGEEYVVIGVSVAAVGALLIVTSRGLRLGHHIARVVSCLLYAGLVVTVLVLANKQDSVGSFATWIPVGVAISGLVGLLVPASSHAHFAAPAQPRPFSPPAIAAVAVAAALVAGSAVVGLHGDGATSYPNYAAADDGQTYEPQCGGSCTTSSASGLTLDEATRTATTFLDELENTSYVSTCGRSSSTPSLDVADYTIDDVTPETSGSYDVSATVTLTDGSVETVTYQVRDENGAEGCVDSDTLESAPQSSAPTNPAGDPATSEPTDVPNVAVAGDPVPTDATLPEVPSGDTIPYTDASTVPTTESEIVEYQPDDLPDDQAAAVRSVLAFMTQINRQDFQAAWDLSTERLSAPGYSRTFAKGFATSHYMQVAFGQPERVSANLMIVPARFASRQDPAAEGYPSGVTDCSYWPQYMFLIARVDGQWLPDIAGAFQGRSAVQPYKRPSSGGARLDPVEQRVAC